MQIKREEILLITSTYLPLVPAEIEIESVKNSKQSFHNEKQEKNVQFGCTEAVIPFTGTFLIT